MILRATSKALSLRSWFLAAAALCAAPAMAQAPTPTSAPPASAPSPAPTGTDAPAPPAQGVVSQPTAAVRGDDDVDQAIADFTRAPAGDAANAAPDDGPRQIHGEVGAAIGSRGYRSGYAEAEIPIGSDSTLGVAVGESQQQLYKHGPTVTGKSLSLSLVVGQPELPKACEAAPPQDEGQPTSLWAQQMHDAAAYSAPACRPLAGYGLGFQDRPPPQP